ncbi:MAG: hypothetical protein MUO76_03165 [Anaerolineaceae bacterium]|nr:hypothetical protein [Anaerolineaceae bacterium]
MKKSVLAIALLLIVIFMVTTPAYADIAPPEQPPGSNLLPEGESTQVRMMAETVLLDVQADAPADSLGQARVTASFSMRNLGTSPETMGVLFPLGADDGFYNIYEINDLKASVNGSAVAVRRIMLVGSGDDEELPWAEFDVTFPAGQDVLIDVTYTLRGTGEYPYISFGYLLHTGAGWKDSIGSVDLIVRLPYEANAYNVFIDSSPGWGQTSSGATLSGRDISWHYDDLEPERYHNLSIVLVMPPAWGKVLTEQANVARNPQDGEAWGRLGKIYKEISRLRRGTRYDASGLELFNLSMDAYEQAVRLLPNDALWHAGFAELLFDHYYFSERSNTKQMGMLRALQELALAYELNQSEPFILDLLDEVHYSIPEGLSLDGDNYTFLWLTATPTFLPNIPPTDTPSPATLPPTLTPEPSFTVVPDSALDITATLTLTTVPTSLPTEDSSESSSGPSFPLCGSTLLVIPLVVLLKKIRYSNN